MKRAISGDGKIPTAAELDTLNIQEKLGKSFHLLRGSRLKSTHVLRVWELGQSGWHIEISFLL